MLKEVGFGRRTTGLKNIQNFKGELEEKKKSLENTILGDAHAGHYHKKNSYSGISKSRICVRKCNYSLDSTRYKLCRCKLRLVRLASHEPELSGSLELLGADRFLTTLHLMGPYNVMYVLTQISYNQGVII